MFFSLTCLLFLHLIPSHQTFYVAPFALGIKASSQMDSAVKSGRISTQAKNAPSGQISNNARLLPSLFQKLFAWRQQSGEYVGAYRKHQPALNPNIRPDEWANNVADLARLERLHNIEIIHASEIGCAETDMCSSSSSQRPTPLRTRFIFIRNNLRDYFPDTNSTRIIGPDPSIVYESSELMPSRLLEGFDIAQVMNDGWLLQPDNLATLYSSNVYKSDESDYEVAATLRSLFAHYDLPLVPMLERMHAELERRVRALTYAKRTRGLVLLDKYLEAIGQAAMLEYLKAKYVPYNINRFVRDQQQPGWTPFRTRFADMMRFLEERERSVLERGVYERIVAFVCESKTWNDAQVVEAQALVDEWIERVLWQCREAFDMAPILEDINVMMMERAERQAYWDQPVHRNRHYDQAMRRVMTRKFGEDVINKMMLGKSSEQQ